MKNRCAPALRVSRLALTGAAVFLLAGPAMAAKWAEPTAAEKAIVEDPGKGIVGAVYLEKFEESFRNTFHVKVRAKVLSKNGFDIGTVDDLDANAYDIEGRTISPDGKVTELSKKDIHTMTTAKAGGVSIQRKGFTMPALEPGCFLEYTYWEYGDLGSESAYHTEILFQEKYATLKQELRTPKNFPYSSTLRNQNGVKIEFKEETNTYVYWASNSPALREEPHGFPVYERAAVVIFAYVVPGLQGRTAEEFWKNATKTVLVPLLKKEMVRPGRVADRLKTIEGSRDADPQARLAAIYRYVQKNVKNRHALREGQSEPKDGWKKNEDAIDTFSHGEGTPFDMTMACASLLRADGWKFRVVFVPDRDTRFFRMSIPSVFQFGGWVLEVPDPKDPAKIVYLSFKHPLLPFGVVPWHNLGVEAFAINIDTEEGAPVALPLQPGDFNSRRREWKVAIAEDGDVKVDRKSLWNGQQAFSVRSDLYHRGKEAWEKETKEDYEKLDPPGQIETVAWEAEENPESELKGTIRLTRKSMAGTLPGGRIEVIPLTMMRSASPFTNADRSGPIYFHYPYLDTDVLEIVPPPGYAIDSLPLPIEHSCGVGKYSVKAQKGTGDSIRITRSFELTRFSGGQELYSTYRGLFDAAARGDSGYSILFKKSAGAAAVKN